MVSKHSQKTVVVPLVHASRLDWHSTARVPLQSSAQDKGIVAVQPSSLEGANVRFGSLAEPIADDAPQQTEDGRGGLSNGSLVLTIDASHRRYF